MELEAYKEIVKRYPAGEGCEHLNLNSNFKIGLGIEHKDFCDTMISAGKFAYQDYAPKYNAWDSYLKWHEGGLELRVWRELGYHFTPIPEDARERLKITVQTNNSDDAESKTLSVEDWRARVKDCMLYLLDFVKENKVPIAIPYIYYSPPGENDSVLWLPD